MGKSNYLSEISKKYGIFMSITDISNELKVSRATALSFLKSVKNPNGLEYQTLKKSKNPRKYILCESFVNWVYQNVKL